MEENVNKIQNIFKILEKNHINFYFNHSKEELKNFILEAISKFKLEDNYDICYIVNYVIKKMLNENDAHTSLAFKKDHSDTLELNFRIINNKLYIYKTGEKCKKYLYSEVLKINGVDINTIIKELNDIVCSQTKGGREFHIEEKLFIPCYLKTLPSIDNKTREFVFTVNNNGIVEEFSAPRGMCLKQNYKYSVDNNIMHIIYSQCKEKKPNQMNDFVDEISKVENIETYIVDLRGNTGGNSQVIKPLIEFLKDKNVIVLIDKYVYSAGRFACVDLKNNGATFIGTDIGTPINCFGNCPPEEYGPFNVAASQKYFPFSSEVPFCVDSKEKLDIIKNNPKLFEPFYIHPDIYVEEDIEALKEGRDVSLEAAYKYLGENKKRS